MRRSEPRSRVLNRSEGRHQRHRNQDELERTAFGYAPAEEGGRNRLACPPRGDTRSGLRVPLPSPEPELPKRLHLASQTRSSLTQALRDPQTAGSYAPEARNYFFSE